MLQPKFLLTKTVPLTIYRTSQGGYVNGDWVDGKTAEVEIQANVQPMRDDELMLMPETERTREWYKVYSASEIRTSKEGTTGWAADEFMWNGDRYKVMKVRRYQMQTLDHWKALAAKVETTQG